jgi:hypothetical protein
MKPYFMSLSDAKVAIDSMVGYHHMTGIMGGEPLLHPQFTEICKYLQTKIPKAQCGLWTCLPEGKEHLREIIVETFDHIFINDHTRDDILHHPALVAANEMPLEGWKKDYLINKCWAQETWSASINPKGAWFCEIAASLAVLLDVKNLGWDVVPGWWARSPQHFISQMAMCHYCGMAMPLKRRCSTEEIDDISPKMFEALKDISPKLIKGKYKIHNLEPFVGEEGQCATYKDPNYRDKIAKRYGMFLVVNDQHFQTPYLLKNWKKKGSEKDAK